MSERDVSALFDLLRPELAELRAYVPHEVPGIDVKLDANEAPAPTSPVVRDVVARAISNVAFERYPDPRAVRLKEAIVRRYGGKSSELLLGCGSDEVIVLVLNAFSRSRGRNQACVLTPTPTFVMYRASARAHGIKPVEVPLDAAWDLDVATTTRAIAMMQPNVVIVASPNNPTGNAMSADRIEALVEACAPARANAFAIVDEAYVDYAGASQRPLRASNPHLGIFRTLSKVGLAALRVGWLEADEGLVAEIDKTRQPYNLSAIAQAAAAAVLESDEAFASITAQIARTIEERDRLSIALNALEGFSVTPSSANFLWVRTPTSAEDASRKLAEDGILVRSFHASGGRLGQQLRITVGNESQNERLLASLTRLGPGRANP